MKRMVGLLVVWSGLIFPGFAEEGMWPPQQLPDMASRLKALGMEISPERLSDLTGDPMNAVISLGGCSASFVSPDGLVITNHHCAYGSIQHNSTPENNLLAKGFLAKSLAEELPAAPGARVYVTVRFEDVTDRVLGGLAAGLTGLQRYQEIDLRRKTLVAECEKEPGYKCQVADYHGGLSYSLVRQLEIRDVRLVYAPAEGIGKFGGDVDNWIWPRHTGDFAFFRAYVGPDGKSADYDPANLPFHPKHYLKVSREGVRAGDFVMVAGYPGTTNRYRLASEVEFAFTKSYPARVELYREWIDEIAQATQGRPDAAIKYVSLESSIQNALKNNQGLLDGYAKSGMLEEKRRLEDDLQAWIQSDPARRAEYGNAIAQLRETAGRLLPIRQRDLYYRLAGRASPLTAARRIYRLAKEKEKPDLEREPDFQERDWPRIRQFMERMDRTYDPQVDRAVWRRFILEYSQLPAASRVAPFDDWFGLEPDAGDAAARIDEVLDRMYAHTRLGDREERLALLDATVARLDASDDPFIRLAARLYESDLALEKEEREVEGMLQVQRPLYMKALLAYLGSRGVAVYPDANSTLRITFGEVKGYSPRDAVFYEPFTTLAGIVEKDTGVDPFNTPPAALDAIKKRLGGRPDAAAGPLPVNFLTTCDTTGGNSGSPTLDKHGRLTGLLFDGNYESVIADWDFIPEITRSIHVDIRYVLWLMEEVDHADRLLEEMGVLQLAAAAGPGRN